MRNIAAFTKADFPIPPYISINRMGTGLVSVTIRDAATQQATITMQEEDWRELSRSIAEDYANGHP